MNDNKNTILGIRIGIGIVLVIVFVIIVSRCSGGDEGDSQIPQGNSSGLGASSGHVIPPPKDSALPPDKYGPQLWDDVIGSGAGTTPDFAALNNPANSDLGADFQPVSALARAVTTADLTGIGREAYPGYWPPAAGSTAAAYRPPEYCSGVQILGANSVKLVMLPGKWAKTLVVWKAVCPGSAVAGPGIGTAYVYSTKQSNQWTPVAAASVPGISNGAAENPPGVEDTGSSD